MQHLRRQAEVENTAVYVMCEIQPLAVLMFLIGSRQLLDNTP
jgi:hypothetical protein